MFSQVHQTILLLALLAAPRVVDAHGKVISWTITGDGVTETKLGQDYGKMDVTAQRRVSQDLVNNDAPRYLPLGDDVVCNSVEMTSSDTWSLDAGSILTPQWSHKTGGGQPLTDEFWPPGHGGPAMEYMAACPSENCTNFNPAEGDWFKIGESVTYDGLWATEKIYKDGRWDIKIPTDLKAGPYLLRHELLSVHGTPGAPQMYPSCIQVNLKSSGNTVPAETYKYKDLYNKFDKTFEKYQIQAGVDDHAPSPTRHFAAPGPPIYDGSKGGDAGSGTNGAANASASPTTSASGSPTSSAAVETGASAAAPSLDPAAASSQAGLSANPDPYAATAPVVPAAGATSAAAPLDPADPARAAVSPPAYPGGPNSSTDTALAAGADAGPAAPIAGPDGFNISNKAVVTDGDAGADAALEKPFPGASSAGGDTVATAETSLLASNAAVTDVVGAPAETALGAGADAPAPAAAESDPSGSANSTSSPATTGTSEYASNIQGGQCGHNTWRCQKKEDGSDYLEVCNRVSEVLFAWELSQPSCPSKCDDSIPDRPICQ